MARVATERKFDSRGPGGGGADRAQKVAAKRQKKQRRNPQNVNPIKGRIRDIERLFKHTPSMPADQRMVLERELHSLRRDLEAVHSENYQNKLIGKYKFVRFIESGKAKRVLKRANKNVGAAVTPTDIAAAKQELYLAQMDLNYVQYFPLNLPYSSLYPSKQDDIGNGKDDTQLIEREVRRDTEMWRLAEKCTADNTLEQLRSGLLTQDHSLAHRMSLAGLERDESAVPTLPKKAAQGKNTVKAGMGQDTVMEDEGSDGDFFTHDG